jgi:hypothetical protein
MNFILGAQDAFELPVKSRKKILQWRKNQS